MNGPLWIRDEHASFFEPFKLVQHRKRRRVERFFHGGGVIKKAPPLRDPQGG